MKVTITERGLEIRRNLVGESPISCNRRLRTSLQTNKKKLHLENLLKVAVNISPPSKIRVKIPRIFSPKIYEEKFATEPARSIIFSSCLSSPDQSPRNIRHTEFRSEYKYKKPVSALISKELKTKKLHEKHLYLQKQRIEVDIQMKERINQARIRKIEQMLDYKNKLQQESETLQKSLTNKSDKVRYKERIKRLHYKRASDWKQPERLIALSTPIRGIVSTPYALLRQRSALSAEPTPKCPSFS